MLSPRHERVTAPPAAPQALLVPVPASAPAPAPALAPAPATAAAAAGPSESPARNVADGTRDSGSGDDVDTDAVGVHGTFLNLGGWRQQVRQLLAETEAE